MDHFLKSVVRTHAYRVAQADGGREGKLSFHDNPLYARLG